MKCIFSLPRLFVLFHSCGFSQFTLDPGAFWLNLSKFDRSVVKKSQNWSVLKKTLNGSLITTKPFPSWSSQIPDKKFDTIALKPLLWWSRAWLGSSHRMHVWLENRWSCVQYSGNWTILSLRSSREILARSFSSFCLFYEGNVRNWRKNVHWVLVNCLVGLSQPDHFSCADCVPSCL